LDPQYRTEKIRKLSTPVAKKTAPFPLSAPVACSMFVKLTDILDGDEQRKDGAVLWIRNYIVWILASNPGQLNNWQLLSFHNETAARLFIHLKNFLKKYVCRRFRPL
jgi:hypothetical protein